MGFALTPTLENPRQKKPTSPRKSAPGEFFAKPNRTRPANRRQPLKTQLGKPTYAYRIASGRPFWPSRDPIEEKGGLNLYGFVFNNPNLWYDFLGAEPRTPLQNINTQLANEIARGKLRGKASVERRKKELIDEWNERNPDSPIDAGDPENFNNGCDCGDLRIRTMPSRWDMGGMNFKRPKPGPWINLSTSKSKKIDKNQRNKRYQYEILNGTCDSYSVTLRQQFQKEDVGSPYTRGQSTELRLFKQDSNTPGPHELEGTLTGSSSNPKVDNASVWNEQFYKIPKPLPGVPQNMEVKKLRVLIQVRGKKKGQDCCLKTYQLN